MSAKITNCFGESQAARRKIPSERITIFAPQEGEWAYNHHPSICCFNGMLIAQWSNGRRQEDDVGQRVFYSYCPADDLSKWSKPRPLVDVRMGREVEATLTPGGFHQHGHTLVSYFGQYEYKPECIDNGHVLEGWGHERLGAELYCIESIDGIHFSEPRSLGVPIVPNQGPVATHTGRLIFCGNVLMPYTDDPTGTAGYVVGGLGNVGASGLADESNGNRAVAKKMGWNCNLCEASFFETDDSVVHLMLRTPNYILYASESTDDGATWSEPVPADFTNSNTKFFFFRLPDRRFLYVGSPDPDGRRNPLVVAVSGDGVRFDKHFIVRDEPYRLRIEGHGKGGVYGYPHACAVGNDLCIIYSVLKENIEISKISLDTLK
jgi:hypothetical protein